MYFICFFFPPLDIFVFTNLRAFRTRVSSLQISHKFSSTFVAVSCSLFCHKKQNILVSLKQTCQSETNSRLKHSHKKYHTPRNHNHNDSKHIVGRVPPRRSERPGRGGRTWRSQTRVRRLRDFWTEAPSCSPPWQLIHTTGRADYNPRTANGCEQIFKAATSLRIILMHGDLENTELCENAVGVAALGLVNGFFGLRNTQITQLFG